MTTQYEPVTEEMELGPALAWSMKNPDGVLSPASRKPFDGYPVFRAYGSRLESQVRGDKWGHVTNPDFFIFNKGRCFIGYLPKKEVERDLREEFMYQLGNYFCTPSKVYPVFEAFAKLHGLKAVDE